MKQHFLGLSALTKSKSSPAQVMGVESIFIRTGQSPTSTSTDNPSNTPVDFESKSLTESENHPSQKGENDSSSPENKGHNEIDVSREGDSSKPKFIRSTSTPQPDKPPPPAIARKKSSLSSIFPFYRSRLKQPKEIEATKPESIEQPDATLSANQAQVHTPEIPSQSGSIPNHITKAEESVMSERGSRTSSTRKSPSVFKFKWKRSKSPSKSLSSIVESSVDQDESSNPEIFAPPSSKASFPAYFAPRNLPVTRPGTLESSLAFFHNLFQPHPVSPPFSDIEGDVVFIPGMYGSHLSDSQTATRSWIQPESFFSTRRHHDIRLPLKEDFEENLPDHLIPEAVVERVGVVNICSHLVDAFRARERRSGGTFRFHPFPYDWRRELQYSSQMFEAFLEKIYENNGSKPIYVVAHSMGGLVSLSVVNRKPHLIRGLVCLGTPFKDVPFLLYGINKGAPFIPNRLLMNYSFHFRAPSCFNFLPRDQSGLVVAGSKTPFKFDWFDVNNWIAYGVSPSLRGNPPDVQVRKRAFLQKYLNLAMIFQEGLQKRGNDWPYPPFVCIAGSSYLSPGQLPAEVLKVKEESSPVPPPSPPTVEGIDNLLPDQPEVELDVQLPMPSGLERGDGLIPLDSARLPEGYDYTLLESSYHHISLPNDVQLVARALTLARNATLSSASPSSGDGRLGRRGSVD